jgi:hypothetical protein
MQLPVRLESVGCPSTSLGLVSSPIYRQTRLVMTIVEIGNKGKLKTTCSFESINAHNILNDICQHVAAL